MTTPRFCSNCGGPLSPNANFCANCGQRVVRSSAPAQPVQPARQAPQAQPARSAQPVQPAPRVQSARPAQPNRPVQPAQQAQAARPVQPAPQAQAPAMPQAAQEVVLGVIPGAARQSGFMGMKMESFVIVLTNLRVLFAAQTNQMLQDNIKQARQEAKQKGAGFFGQWGAQLGANAGQQYMSMPPQQIMAEHPNNFFLPANQLRRIRLKEQDDNQGGATQYFIEFETPGGKYKFRLSYINSRAVKKQLQQFYGNIVR